MSNFSKTVEFIKNQFYKKSLVQLHEPVFFGNEKKYLNDTIESTFVSSVGEYVTKFEKELSILTKTKKAVAVVNGTSALQLALKIAGVKSDDEVITQALTFVATANSALYCGADVDFVDIDPHTYNISVQALAAKLEIAAQSGCVPKVVIPVHLTGQPCDMQAIHALSVEYGFSIVEDASHNNLFSSLSYALILYSA